MKKTAEIKPIGYLDESKIGGDCDPLTATFTYVSDHKRSFGFGNIAAVWKTATYPNIMREVNSLKGSDSPKKLQRAEALERLGEQIEPHLDFYNDDIGEHSALVMSGHA